MSLVASLVFKANGIFEVYFYIKMLSKFDTLFFSKNYPRDNLGPRLLCLFKLKDSGEAFCCSPSDQRSKDHCRRRQWSQMFFLIILLVKVKPLKDLFCKSHTLNLNQASYYQIFSCAKDEMFLIVFLIFRFLIFADLRCRITLP